MQIIHANTYEEMSCVAADLICAQIKEKPKSVLGLATGSTPIGMYRDLLSRVSRGEVDFKNATTVNLDEYVGLPPTHPQSYRAFMNREFLCESGIPLEHTHIPLGSTEDLEAECCRYDRLVDTLGGIDLQILGIGLNGHIGFNEPGDAFIPDTHLVALNSTTLKANARFFDNCVEAVPTRAITLGMRAIMQARKVLLLSADKRKQEILDRSLNGPISPAVPASILQLHPALTVIYC